MRISDWSSDVCSSDLLQNKHDAVRLAGSFPETWQSGYSHPMARSVRFDCWAYQRSTPVRLGAVDRRRHAPWRSEEHTSELQSLMSISYAVFCLTKKNILIHTTSLIN